ncbi:MAG: hypothetical protein KL863_27690 [Rhizobium sp.]|nr:hypothetical protein [Rhizobium sp.]
MISTFALLFRLADGRNLLRHRGGLRGNPLERLAVPVHGDRRSGPEREIVAGVELAFRLIDVEEGKRNREARHEGHR